MIDVIVTTDGSRLDLFEKMWASYRENTFLDTRTTLVCDGCKPPQFVDPDLVIEKSTVQGLAPALNDATALLMQKRVVEKGPRFICYIQDDIIFQDNWLSLLKYVYEDFSDKSNVGFATGAECPEHPQTSETMWLGLEVMFKPWIRATCMFTEFDYWASMFPIPPIDPETGRERGRPHDGLGSGVDWHMIRVHPNSVCKTGRTNIVIPGLIKHIGFDRSTWLNRPLPESDEDIETIQKELSREAQDMGFYG